MKKKAILFLCMLSISLSISAQKIRTMTSTNSFGHVFSVETWEKINNSTEKYKKIYYDPSSNSRIIWGILTYTLVNGKKEGRYEELNNSGKEQHIKTFYNYVNDKRQGKAAHFHDKDKLYYEENYVDDKVEGEVIYYHFDGKVRSRGMYKKGEKEGEWINYYWGTDKMQSRGSYKNGRRDGIWYSYFEDGRQEPEVKYINGEMDEGYKSSATNTFVNPWRKLRGLCLYIGSDVEAEQPKGPYKYIYQQKILDAAKVDIEKDSEILIAQKVSQLWKEYEEKLTCNDTTFDVIKGSIIKYAVGKLDDKFIDDVIKWKIDLNKVDEFDEKTVLDYVKDKIERAKGSSLEPRYNSYYRWLKNAGAKHKSEL